MPPPNASLITGCPSRWGGIRQRQIFATYSEAKAAAEAKEIHEKPAAASLSAKQSQDALAARERLETLRQSTGRKFTLLGGSFRIC